MNRIILFVLVNIISISCFSKSYHVSKHGENNIKHYETCQLTSYWDSDGYSIGWGHHTKSVRKNQHISQSQADKYFREDMKMVNEAINNILTSLPYEHDFPQNFIDGLGDLIYNCGIGNVINSDFYKKLKVCRKNNKKDINFSIAYVKSMYISAPGNVERRYETHKRMLL